MNGVVWIAAAGLAAFAFWRLTRYFWLKIYYRWRGVQDVDAGTAHALQHTGGVPVLDVREPFEFEAAHIEGVTLIPLGQLAQRAGELAHLQQDTLLIICRGGVRSAKACLILRQLGFATPRNVAGGMNDWKRLQLPYVARAANGPS
ncbi:MAG: rhodanese-like domain-containing protein [Rhodoferax sp.]